MATYNSVVEEIEIFHSIFITTTCYVISSLTDSDNKQCIKENLKFLIIFLYQLTVILLNSLLTDNYK